MKTRTGTIIIYCNYMQVPADVISLLICIRQRYNEQTWKTMHNTWVNSEILSVGTCIYRTWKCRTFPVTKHKTTNRRFAVRLVTISPSKYCGNETQNHEPTPIKNRTFSVTKHKTSNRRLATKLVIIYVYMECCNETQNHEPTVPKHKTTNRRYRNIILRTDAVRKNVAHFL